MTVKKVILILILIFSTTICHGELNFSPDGISIKSEKGLHGKISLNEYNIGIQRDFEWLNTNLTYSLTSEGENKDIDLNIIFDEFFGIESSFYFYCGLPNKYRSGSEYLYQMCLLETNTGLTFNLIMEGEEPTFTKLKISKVIDFEDFKIEPVFDYKERGENSSLLEGGIRISFPF
ncbi:hypothetical protein KJ603_02100 [Patescibacteria group bacterium]|nr:hypothetical protein [Patescibacteria group bacterium]